MPTSQLTVDVLLGADDHRAALESDARQGLTATPKTLSPIWFYDDRGSALFDDITRLPEYYLTRAERSLLAAHAPAIAAASGADILVELGSGTSDKTRLLLDAMAATGGLRRYAPVDVSEEMLRTAASSLAADYPTIEIRAVVGDFRHHLSALPEGRRRLVAFFGSTIGNLTPAERARFLFDLDCALGHEDRLLLGVDLAKDPARLVAAYDDSDGVTGECNRNALHVLNATLAADFRPELFDHLAVWDPDNQWIEMRLRATVGHTVHVAALGLDVRFERGEELRTEISAKFAADGIAEELAEAGFVVEHTWQDRGEFLLILARPYC